MCLPKVFASPQGGCESSVENQINQPGIRRREHGYSLIELLVVIALIGVVSAVAYAYLNGRQDRAGGAERALRDVARCLQERRTAAIRLRQLRAATSLERFTSPPIELNLRAAESTRPLLTDGVDADGDGRDDNTGASLTVLLPPASGGVGTWQYAYSGAALTLPTGWRVARSGDDLGPGIPLIAGGGAGRGEPVTQLGFDDRGAALAANAAGGFDKLPAGAIAGSATASAAPFWAVYVVNDQGAAVAVAVHPTGALELWHWDGTQWSGFGRRTL